MKPKARKFRIKRVPTSTQGALRQGAKAAAKAGLGMANDAAARAAKPKPTIPVAGAKARLPDKAASTQPEASDPGIPMTGQVESTRETSAEVDIEEIRKEGLTGRQLRLARRIAQKHNLAPTSDFDAVRLLRKSGIDPFRHTNMLELVVPRASPEEQKTSTGKVQLPQTVPFKETLPSTELSPAQQREREIMAIQRDILARRRKKLMALMARLAFFVLIPTALAAWYFYEAATPMYSTKSEFLIVQADNAGGSGLGGLLTGTQFATNQDSIGVQSFLQSKEAMLRLDTEAGFKAHFSQDWIDPIQRLEEDASNEAAYKAYKKNVKIGYDPTEGVIRMEVVAADPEIAAEFSRRLISYAEERVNDLSQRKRGDQMKDALQSFEAAEAERRAAQEALVQLQQRGAILDPEGVIASLRSQISGLETQLQERELELAALMDNARPNAARVAGAEADIRRMQEYLTRLNERMVDASKGENSLAQLSVRIQMAQADLATRDMMLQSALQQVEQTRLEANRQVRYLTTAVSPVSSEEASYPRKFENTVLAFLIFGGIYLMISLTSSILREQVTA